MRRLSKRELLLFGGLLGFVYIYGDQAEIYNSKYKGPQGKQSSVKSEEAIHIFPADHELRPFEDAIRQGDLDGMVDSMNSFTGEVEKDTLSFFILTNLKEGEGLLKGHAYEQGYLFVERDGKPFSIRMPDKSHVYLLFKNQNLALDYGSLVSLRNPQSEITINNLPN